jgi:hypothetical protein
MTILSFIRGDLNMGNLDLLMIFGVGEKVALLLFVQALFEMNFKMLMLKVHNSKKVYFPLIA